jgi:4-amino-4-deoxy-L-arabinose transferase-like glycosyltransferase
LNLSTSFEPVQESEAEPPIAWLALLGQWKAGTRFFEYPLIIAMLCLTRIGGLTNQSLWFDEGYTLALATSPNFHAFLKSFAGFTMSEHLQPLYYLLIFGWSRIAGTSDFALRFPSAIASVASGLLLYGIVLHVAPVRRRLLALMVTLAFSLSSFSIFYAQEARPYALVQCLAFAVIATWLRRRYPEGGVYGLSVKATSSAFTALFGFVLAVACTVSIFNALLVVALMVSDFIGTNDLASWRKVWAIPSLICAAVLSAYGCVAFWILPSLNTHDVVSIKQPLWMNIGYTLYGVTFGTSLAPADNLLRTPHKLQIVLHFWPLLLPGIVVLAFLAGITVMLSTRSSFLPDSTITLAIAAMLYAVIFFAAFGAIGHLNILPRHASSLFALLFVVVATVVACLPGYHYQSPLRAKLVVIGLIGLVLCNAKSLYRYALDPSLRKDDYRSAVRYIPHDGLPLYLVEGQPALMEHYGLRVIPVTDVSPDRLGEYLYAKSSDSPVRLVVNQYRGYLWDKRATVAAEIAPQYACVTEQQLSYMDVERCVPRPSDSSSEAVDADGHAQ